METTAQREMTFGEKAVGLNFNPSNDPTVQKIKELYAQLIDICNTELEKPSEALSPGKMRLLEIAIMEAQGAQMWAVKAATWK